MRRPIPVATFLSIAILCQSPLVAATNQGGGRLVFCCAPDNDLYLATGRRYPRFDHPLAALKAAPIGSAVLILADQYPARTTLVEPAGFTLAETKHLSLFLEYPAAIPGLQTDSPRTTTWERIIVASDRFEPLLPRLRILAAHDCHFVPVSASVKADLVVARIAGYDTAIYGIPSKEAFPILFELPERKLVIATTKLSSFVTGRFAPARDWQWLWESVLAALDPAQPFRLRIRPVVAPAYGPSASLPRHFEHRGFTAAADWWRQSHLLVNPADKPRVYQALAAGQETIEPPRLDAPQGDGSLGILEGYASGILHDGQQVRRLPLRDDCTSESAMIFALDSRLNRRTRSADIASNLLDFVYFNSGMCQGPRANPEHGAFGLIGWGDVAPLWLVANYGDDNARGMLASAVVAASLNLNRWDEPLMRALLANLRTTGKLGFRGDRIDVPALEQNGWKHYYQAETVNYSPHFEAYLWACYLWAYHQTGFRPFLDRSRTAIAMTMNAYPDQWRWQDNLERAHMLLCLAWLVRLEDTGESRAWLNRVAGDLLADQQPSGAIHERLGRVHGGHYRTPQSNEDYGTGETPLLQQNGDPVSDQLYTTGFALLGLHEAAAATGDDKLKRAEDKLAEYLCRIQTRSTRIPYLSGTWFRAFDDHRWEAWASSADIGWGAWSIESGWGQAWTAAVLGLRELHTSVWDFTAKSRVGEHFPKLRVQLGLQE